ncbi:MAG TPA: MOP flippase family protein [Verrucomicrobiae bacterium]|nr:MOP flippase family protein [Verrucomicrobiae bacterium]
MSSSLKTKTLGALSWSLVQELSQRGLQFVIGIVLARLLGPKEFGMLAMLTIFIAVSQALVDSGFGSALIQRKNPTQADESSVFYFNIFLGFLMAGLLCLAAPWISQFYNQPQLTSLVRVLSVVLIINSISVVQNALMVRRLDFKRQAMVSVASMSVSGVAALIMAWRGFGVWSLVGQQVTASIVRTAMLWRINTWRPGWIFSWKSLRELFGFGSGMMASALTNRIFDNLTSLVIGKAFSAAMLGYYSRAVTLQDTVSQSLANVANRVTFPVFSQLQNDPERMKRGLRKAMTTLAFVQFPMLIGLAAVAKPLILFLLTEKWAPSIPYLQLLCFAGLLYPMHLLNLNVLTAMGRSDLYFRLGIVKRVLQVVAIVATFPFGVLAMVVGQVAVSFISFFINGYFTKRFIGYSILEQANDLLPYAAASVAMGISVFIIDLPFGEHHAAQLFTKICLGVIIYLILSRGLRLSALGEMKSLFRKRTFATN